MNSSSILRVIAVSVLIVMGASLMAKSALAFSDVSTRTSYRTAIEALADRGIIEGYADGTFHAEQTINRAEFLKIVLEGSAKVKGDVEIFEGENCFPDARKEWFAKYVCNAKNKGIIAGYPDGTFKPDRHITFVEASKILSLAFGQNTTASGHVWYEPYVRALEGVKAIPPSISAATHEVTRGEMVEMMWRLIEKREDQPTKSYLNVKHPELSVDLTSASVQRATSCTDLQALLEEAQPRYGPVLREDRALGAPMRAMPSGASESDIASKSYSQTNVQVKGVDEADIVKTDGTYLYLIARQKLRIVRAHPGSQMREVSVIDFREAGFTPSDLYLESNNLIVMGQHWLPSDLPVIQGKGAFRPEIWPGPYPVMRTEVRIYDVSDHASPSLVRTVAFDGTTVSSRRIGTKLTLVLNQSIWGPYPLPRFTDSNLGPDDRAVARCTDVAILPPIHLPHYLIVAVIPIADVNAEVQREVVLGSAEHIYASEQNLYIAATEWRERFDGTGQSQVQTHLTRFAFTEDGVTVAAQGSVPGNVLNQFSMDEHEGTFRVATTIPQRWDPSGESPSVNSLSILDMNLDRLGEITDIAPGEQIYAVRFLGNRAYVVTFKTIDPLFVIDTTDPRHPSILGKLKIPGYSTYIHPYDEDHIIGFGKEVDEEIDKDKVHSSSAVYYTAVQGLKVALFDVADVEHPRELHKIVIGDRGSDSPLLTNHKALLFDRGRNLLSFPALVMEFTPEQKRNHDLTESPTPVFQGAYIYELTISGGFTHRGRITHEDDDQAFLKAGGTWYGDGGTIDRILRIDDSLLTVSEDQVRSSALSDLKEEGRVEF